MHEALDFAILAANLIGLYFVIRLYALTARLEERIWHEKLEEDFPEEK